MKSNFSRPFRFNTYPLNSTRKKLQNQKIHLFHPVISWVYNNHYVDPVFFLKKEKNCYHGEYRISQSGRFWWDQNVIFGWNQRKNLWPGWLIHKRNTFTWSPFLLRPINGGAVDFSGDPIKGTPMNRRVGRISWVYNNHYVILIFHLVFLWANIKEKTC